MKTFPPFLTLCLVAIAMPTLASAADARPNILYLYVDDMGWGSIGPNGQAERQAKGKPYVRTPNLDRLADQGINFTRGYGCHVCSPARSSQQTGFHQGHTFADRNDPDNAKKAMRSDDICMGDALSAAGYATGYWGKWGYGGSKDQAKPVIQNVQTLPTSHGYQHVLAELHHVRAHTFYQPTLWSAPASQNAVGGLALTPNSLARYRNNPKYPAMPAMQNHVDYPKVAYCDDTYAFAALDFVRRQGMQYNKTGQPFFGLLAVQIPHAPFNEISQLPQWDKAYANDRHFKTLAKQSQQWAAMVTRIDAHFGNILAALDDPNNDGDASDSIAANTLVIFQSDNGGPSGKNNSELDANGGLRGNKGQIQEGGIRVPLVMRWPAKITRNSKLKAGTNCDRVVDVTDLLPTFCELAGTTTPLGIDGVSIAPLLQGNGKQRNRDFIIHEAGNGRSIIHGKYKLVHSASQRKKNKDGESFKLYDLEADPAEKRDIRANHRELAKKLETLMLGERVAEPKGFANTYHHWTGSDGASTSEADNWSDYEYANAGITYMTDRGTPQLSWIAHIANSGIRSNTARADADLEFLGVEIRGHPKKDVTQSLVLAPKVNLTGRNEVRIGHNGTLTIDQGTVSSLRWIDILKGGTLNGAGKVNATIYNAGTVTESITAATDGKPSFKIAGDYHQSPGASLELLLQDNRRVAMAVNGHATLDGTLTVSPAIDFKPEPGATYTLLSAARITGKFANAHDEITTAEGLRFAIHYNETSVTLVLK